MPAVKYSHNYNEIKQDLPAQKTYQTVPVHKKQEKKINQSKSLKSSAAALNFALLKASCCMTLAFIAVYSFVAVSETKLSNLHSKISDLNYENIELENKLENVKSYYSVDNKVSSTADFDKAKKVLEVNHVGNRTVLHSEPQNYNLSNVTGF